MKEEKLEEANKEIDNISKSQVSVIMVIPGGNGAKTFNCNVQEAEIAKLSAMLQKTEMKAKSLEITVEQKNKENEVNHLFDIRFIVN